MKRSLFSLPFLAVLSVSAHAAGPLAGLLMSSGLAGGIYNYIPDVAFDKAGDMLLGGVNLSSRVENFNMTIMKLSGTSVYQEYWLNPYDFANGDDQVAKIFTDSGNNVVVVGPSVGLGTDYDWAILKYTDAGSNLWTVRYNGPSSGRDYPVGGGSDSSGYLYFGGLSDDGFAPKMTVLKLSPTGHQVWVKTVTFPVANRRNVDAFTVSPNGDSYLLSDGNDAHGNNGFFVQSYDAGGALRYATFVKNAIAGASGNSICADAAGNAYIAGTENSVMTSASFVAKLLPTGVVKWSQAISVNNYTMENCQVATDPSGNVFTYVEEATASGDMRLAKYDPNGAPMWNHVYAPGTPSLQGQLGVDSRGDIYVSTSFNNGSFYEARVAKWNTAGNIVWEMNGLAFQNIDLSCLKVDPNFDVYISGGSYSPQFGFSGCVSKFTQTPLVSNDVYSTTKGVSINQAAPGVLHNDLYTKGATVTLTQSATFGTVTLHNDGSFTYVPGGGFQGTDKFQYTAQKALQNGSLTSSPGTVTIHVN